MNIFGCMRLVAFPLWGMLGMLIVGHSVGRRSWVVFGGFVLGVFAGMIFDVSIVTLLRAVDRLFSFAPKCRSCGNSQYTVWDTHSGSFGLVCRCGARYILVFGLGMGGRRRCLDLLPDASARSYMVRRCWSDWRPDDEPVPGAAELGVDLKEAVAKLYFQTGTGSDEVSDHCQL